MGSYYLIGHNDGQPCFLSVCSEYRFGRHKTLCVMNLDPRCIDFKVSTLSICSIDQLAKYTHILGIFYKLMAVIL